MANQFMKARHVIMYNSPASYNTCLISTLYIGMGLEKVDVTVKDLFDLLFEHIEIQKFGKPLDMTLKGPGSSHEIDPDEITQFLNAVARRYDISIDIYGICGKKMFSYGSNMYITHARYYGKIGRSHRTVKLYTDGGHFFCVFGKASTKKEGEGKLVKYSDLRRRAYDLEVIYRREVEDVAHDIALSMSEIEADSVASSEEVTLDDIDELILNPTFLKIIKSKEAMRRLFERMDELKSVI